jgi:flagellar secretion chaperone FliS
MNSYEAAAHYRQIAAQGVHPVGWVVRLYDALVEDFRRALSALRSREVEKRTTALNHALLVIAELESVLDHDRGGEVARHLESLYKVARPMIVEANVWASPERIERLIGMFLPVRQAWQQAEHELAGGGRQTPVTPHRPQQEMPAEADDVRSVWRG